MNLFENIKIALYSIKTNAFRAFLTMLGIIIGVGAVISIITIGNSSKDYIVNMIRAVGGQSVSIGVNTSKAQAGDYITENDIEAISKIDVVDNVSPVMVDFGKLSTQFESNFSVAMGTNEQFGEISSIDIVHGRYFNKNEYQSQKNVIVIDTSTAIAFFNDENAVGKSIDFTLGDNLVSFKIIGVFKLQMSELSEGSNGMGAMMSSMGMPDSSPPGRVYFPSTVFKTLTTSNGYDNIYISTQDINDLDSAGDAAVNLLIARHNNLDRQIYSSINMASMIDLLDSVINVFTAFISTVGAISLIVGGIGVMNIMLVSVTERTREIGIRKALGARTGTILFQFLTESIIICLIGGFIGMLLGFGLSFAVSSYMGVPLSIKASTILIAVGFSSVIGIFFGIYPAKKAAKMPPIEALRRE